jgi:small subunit ribosomal protein S17
MTNRKKLKGVVVSDSMDKTVAVRVGTLKKHKKYNKFIKSSNKYKAHDADNIHKKGDLVTIEECRPISKDKHFKVS